MSELDKIQVNPISRSSNVEHEPGATRKISKEERSGVSSTDLEPEAALGVGVSVSHRGEEFGRRAEGSRWGKARKGRSQRPVGGSAPRDDSTVAPQQTITPDSPYLPRGDQGG